MSSVNESGSAQSNVHDSYIRVAKTKPELGLFRQPVNINSSFPKPRKGGLWTAPASPNGGTAWTDWCLSEEFQDPPFHLWRLVPEPGHREYVIDDYGDLNVLMLSYGREAYPDEPIKSPLAGSMVLDWERLAERYDALTLTDDGQWATRMTTPYDLYGWDCASTLWLNWKFSEVIDLGLWSPARHAELSEA